MGSKQENCKVEESPKMGGWWLSAAKPQKCRHWGFAALSHQPPSVCFFPQADFADLLPPILNGA